MGCHDKVLETKDSPDKKSIVFYVENQCGATAPNSFLLSVQPSKHGYTFKSEGEGSEIFLIIEKKGFIKFKWLDNDMLKVNIPDKVKIYKKDNVAINGIKILYEER